MFKRIALFLITNIAIMTTLTLSMFLIEKIFGINVYSYSNGYSGLLIFAAIIGFGGSFISLFLSKFLAKTAYRIQLIDSNNPYYGWIYKDIEELSKKANIGMPEVGIYDGPPNAFATGWNRNSALVAVSTGLINSMKPNEVKGVLAHEVTHVSSGDMVTMTLLQGLLNTFVIFLARIVGDIIDKSVFKSEERGIGYIMTVIVLEIVFSILASIIIMWFSRYREYKADEGAVKLSGKEGIYNALAKLGTINPPPLKEDMRAFGIVGFLGLFRSHPPIEKRLEHIANL